MTDVPTTPTPRQATVTLRPDWRSLLVVPLLLLLLLAGPSWWLADLLDLTSLRWLCSIAAGSAVVVVMRVVMGRTEIGPDGIVARRPERATVPWSQIERISIEQIIVSRMVKVGRSGLPDLLLAAPRTLPPFGTQRFAEQVAVIGAAWRQHRPDAEITVAQGLSLPARLGALAVAVLVLPVSLLIVVDRPWHEPWWPGVHEARDIPRACAALPAQLLARVVTADAVSVDVSSRVCRWKNDGTGPEFWDGRRNLELRYALSERSTSASGTDEARKSFAAAVAADGTGRLSLGERRPTATPIRGLGDEATLLRGTAPGEPDVEAIEVYVRRANVIIVVLYSTRAVPPAERQAAALAVAEAATVAVAVA